MDQYSKRSTKAAANRRSKMKTARHVEIPTDRPLTLEEFIDLRDHAYASAFWNVTHYNRSEQQVRDKLIAKGYVDGSVNYLDKHGKTKSFDIIEHTLEELKQRELLGDDDYTRRFITSKLSQGWGMSRIRMELLRRGINDDQFNHCLEVNDFSEEKEDALMREVKRVINSSTIRKVEDPYKRHQKILQTLMRKGFNYDDIRDSLQTLEEIKE